jgi:hypothetical protein
MKTIGRILIILAAAMVVVGATLAITHNASPAQFPASDPGSEAFRPGGDRLGNLDSGQTSPRPEAFDGGFRRGRDEIGGRSFFSAQLTRNLAVMAGLVVVVTLLERLLKIRRPMWR